MKSLIVLFLIFLSFVFAGEQVQAQTGNSTETPENRLRLVCEKNNKFRFWEKVFPDRVVILEQVSNHDSLSPNRVNGSDFISVDPSPGIMKVQFRLNIYNASLVSSEKTEEQIIDELLGREPDLSYNGFVHRDGATIIVFSKFFNPENEPTSDNIEMSVFLDKYIFTNAIKRVMEQMMDPHERNGDGKTLTEITADDIENQIASEVGRHVSNWGWLSIKQWSKLVENGSYLCRDPILL